MVSWRHIETLQITPIPGSITYLQDVVFVPASAGKPARYILAQDLSGNTRFLLYNADGSFTGEWMVVKDGGHGATFKAYRSAAGNMYIWTWVHNETRADRILWQRGKTVSAGTPMDYKGGRPMDGPGNLIGFRRAGKTTETISVHNRLGFTDGAGGVSSAPLHEVTVKKTSRVQQCWAVGANRFYRLSGKTNQDAGKGTLRHVLEVFSWSGKIVQTVDLTSMHVPTTSDEPEGLSFRNGNLIVGKREGGGRPNRSYPLWEITGLV